MTATGALREPLERLYREFDYGARISRDAIEFPLRYTAADDRELVALLTTCLAYGRVDLFGRALEGVLRIMAPSPAAFVRDFDAQRDGGAFASFIYRFNRPRDLVAFCVAARDLLARHGTLEKVFVAGDRRASRSNPARRSSGSPARFSRRISRDVFPARAALARLPPPVPAGVGRRARASACTCSCAGWCGARRPTWACGRPSRPRAC